MILNLEILKNGNLKISFAENKIWTNAEQRAEVNDSIEKTNPVSGLADLMDTSRYIGNDWHVFSADQLGHLSEAPMICKGCIGFISEIEPEDWYQLEFEHSWYFPLYQISDWREILLRDGECIFIKH